MSYHSSDGWHWDRLQDGTVVLTLRNKDLRIIAQHELPAAVWASVVASVSLRGECSATRDRAPAQHMEPQP